MKTEKDNKSNEREPQGWRESELSSNDKVPQGLTERGQLERTKL